MQSSSGGDRSRRDILRTRSRSSRRATSRPKPTSKITRRGLAWDAPYCCRMKVLSVVGNRPQFIKSAPLSVALRERGIEEVTLHTGQHYDRELSAVFFEELGLREPAYRLGISTLPRDEMLAQMQPGVEDALEREH